MSSRGEEMEPGGDRGQTGVHSDVALKKWEQSNVQDLNSWNLGRVTEKRDSLIQESDSRSKKVQGCC